MRKGKVYVKGILAGIIQEDSEGFLFVYEDELGKYIINLLRAIAPWRTGNSSQPTSILLCRLPVRCSV